MTRAGEDRDEYARRKRKVERRSDSQFPLIFFLERGDKKIATSYLGDRKVAARPEIKSNINNNVQLARQSAEGRHNPCSLPLMAKELIGYPKMRRGDFAAESCNSKGGGGSCIYCFR